MATVNFAPEQERPPLDRALEEAADRSLIREKPVRIRVQPDLYDYEQRAYQAWNGLSWILEITDVEEGRRLREGLQHFFKLFGQSEAAQGELLASLRENAELMTDTATEG